MPDTAALFELLDAIALACEEERWDDIETLFRRYERGLHALKPTVEQREELEALQSRQQALQTLLSRSRDASAAELQRFAAQQRSIKQYSGT